MMDAAGQTGDLQRIERTALASAQSSWISFRSICGFCWILLLLAAIAIPGQSRAPSATAWSFATAMLGVIGLYATVGMLVAVFGLWAVQAIPARRGALQVLCWLAMPFFPFGTWAGVRTLLVLRWALTSNCSNLPP